MAALNFDASKVTPAKGVVDAPVKQVRNWSPYQENIFGFVADPTAGNLLVVAVAGSGKSTTGVEATTRIPVGASCIFLAFNKAIAEELKARGVNARTYHSLTYNPVMKSRMVNSVETNKLRFLCKQNLTGDDEFIYSNFICRLVGLARQTGIGCLVPDSEEEWIKIVEYHDLELENENGNITEAIELARDLLTWSNASNLVDFDDMLYFAVKDGVALPKFDYIFVDEAQDTNAIQRAILRKIMHAGSRVILVGDEKQAIYGFRGADSDSLRLLSEEFNCTELPLTVSYRCANNVVKYAQQWVKYIEAAPGAPDGEVINLQDMKLSKLLKNTASGQVTTGCQFVDRETGEVITTQSDIHGFLPDDLIVCRTVKPLVELAFRFLRAKIPVRVMGRDIGVGLKALVNKMKAHSVDDLQIKLEAWAMREVDKAIAKQLESKAEAVQDKADCILCLIDSLGEDDPDESVDKIRTIPALLQTIDSLFDESKRATTLATIHKAKGLEALRVWWLNSSKCPAKWAKQAWQQQQELNLCYVAATRAKEVLYLIEDGSGNKQRRPEQGGSA